MNILWFFPGLPAQPMASYLPSGVGLVSARKGEGSEDGDEDPRWAKKGAD